MHGVKGFGVKGLLLALALFSLTPASSADKLFLVHGWQIDPMEPEPAPVFKASLFSFPLLESEQQALGQSLLKSHWPPAPVARPDDAVMRTLDHLRAGRDRQALAVVEAHLRLEPDEPRYIQLAALISARLKRFDQADQYYRRYLEAYPRDMPSQLAHGHVLLKSGHIAAARDVLSKASRQHPYSLAAYYFNTILIAMDSEPQTLAPASQERRELTMSQVHFLLRLMVADLEIFRDVLSEDALIGLCLTWFGCSDPEQLPRLRKAMDRYRAALHAKNSAQAAASLREMDQAGATGSWLMFEKIQLLEQSQPDLALAMAHQACRQYPLSLLLPLKAVELHLAQTEPQLALALLRACEQRKPKLAHLQFLKAIALVQAGQEAAAWKTLEHLAATHPTYLKAWLLDAQKTYASVLRNRSRSYAELCRRVGIPPEQE